MESRPGPAPGLNRNERSFSSPMGEFVPRDGESYFRISSFHRLAPFLMTLASDTDLWMFITSGGGLTAGRVDPDGSLFPYRTVDELHDAHHHTGPLTLVRIEGEDGCSVLWEPFSPAESSNPGVERNLYKNAVGNRLVFEEVHRRLGLTFSYGWAACDEFGWVRTATLENLGAAPVRLNLLDGLRNILPHGAPLSLYQQAGNLVDAYKKSEVDPESGLGIFSLTAGITDRAEALESLRANTVWCCGLEGFRVHLSSVAIDAFRQGRVLAEDKVLNGTRGNYLVSGGLELGPGAQASWHILGDTGRDHAQVVALRRRIIREEDGLADRVTASIRLATENLRRNVASADGLQMSGVPESWSHHFANVLFNNMRGGVFARNYDVPVGDLLDFLATRNRAVADRWRSRLEEWPATITIDELRRLSREAGDPDFERLGYEFLPLYFGRRHGDPSRPWNRFSIRVRNRNGERELNYEGNWRDIFQNWEALGTAFPGFLSGMVAKFVNASTRDGYNPYRITRDGIDWEVAGAEDPWSNIGYWGDHQIVYLMRLLEAWNRHDPAAIEGLLGEEIFSYADVPYRIKPYADLLRDPSDTIDFDAALAARIEERVAVRGTDGKLVTGPDDAVLHVNLLEKLLVPALSKLSNLVPGAGIWMNTQRPEWNDANNALAGGGVSVVTLCYLRRYLGFLGNLLDRTGRPTLAVSTEVVEWLQAIAAALASERNLLGKDTLTAPDRKRMMDALGAAFDAYRATVYDHGFSGRTDLPIADVAEFCRTARLFIDQSIAANRRPDGLYHTYNILAVTRDASGVDILRLQEMLEGQVAVLSSGMLDPADALDVVERLFASSMYRSDQGSFLLYPEHRLPGFLEKNQVRAARVAGIGLLQELLEAGDSSLLIKDADGGYHFHGDLQSADSVQAVLDGFAGRPDWSARVARDRTAVLDLFEEVFQHKSYTGRSGAMFGYEGQGCIYWHMVAKLLLAVQEILLQEGPDDLSPQLRVELSRMYFRIRAGIGYQKSVAEYGAFPTDPYSHTPAGGGAKQPGMTGQVKEEILTRRGELGIRVQGGAVEFRPGLLRISEFTRQPAAFEYFDLAGDARTLVLPAGSLAFTLCQVPVVYGLTDGDGSASLRLSDGSTVALPDTRLDPGLSAEIFKRSGRINLIQVEIPRTSLC